MAYNPEIVSACIAHNLEEIRDQHGENTGAYLADEMFNMLRAMRSKVFQGKMGQPESQDMSFSDKFGLPASIISIPAMACLAGSCDHVFNMPEQEKIKEVLSDKIVNVQDAMDEMRVGMAM